jgi:hypothetical protein
MFSRIILIFIIITFCPILSAQSDSGNVVVINFSEFKFPDEVSVPEFDSLNYLYTKNVYDKNEFIISYKTLRHWWGNNSNDFIVIYEVSEWDDVIKASNRSNELFEEHWDTLEKRKAFNQAYYKYFTVKRPDEVYRELKYNFEENNPIQN